MTHTIRQIGERSADSSVTVDAASLVSSMSVLSLKLKLQLSRRAA